VIRRSIIEKVFGPRDYVDAVERAFRFYGEGKVQMPPKVYLEGLAGPDGSPGDLRFMPVYVPAIAAAGAKDVNVHPANRELPAVMANIRLYDPSTGFLLALLDGTHITNMRTGAAGAVAAKYLSREDSRTAAFVGAGAQARTQLACLVVVRPEIAGVTVYDPNAETMRRFADEAKAKYGLDAHECRSPAEAVSVADIVTTVTPARGPVVDARDVRPGTHVNAIGADARGKQELDPSILKKARVVIDSWEQASHSGEINVPLLKGLFRREDVYAEIGEIVTGRKKGRESRDQVTVFDSTGLAVQDIVVATEIYRRLTSDPNLDATLDRIDLMA
jgi:alanine dehydrogenase